MDSRKIWSDDREADAEGPPRDDNQAMIVYVADTLPVKGAYVAWFTWIGGTQADSAFYYRVQSPVIVIEFDHQRPANLRKFAADPMKPTQQHIHCVVRTPNGNDYGKDLLRQHYLAHRHST